MNLLRKPVLESERTLFTASSCDMLAAGLPNSGPRLTLREIYTGITARIENADPDDTVAWPELHLREISVKLEAVDEAKWNALIA